MSEQTLLHLWDDGFIYITPAIQSGLTARPALTLLASISGHPFILEARDGTRAHCAAAVVAPDVPRRLDADGCGLISINLDPASSTYRMFSAWMGGRGIVPLDARVFGVLREGFEPALHGVLCDAQLRSLSHCMVDAVTGSTALSKQMDPRIERLLQLIRTNPSLLQREDLSAMACLSRGRLSHLFREQVGLSVKRYLLWSKLRRSSVQLADGQPLTHIALASGFSDAAHMSRTFRDSFGLQPSFLVRQVKVVTDGHTPDAWRSLAGAA
ncbi:AraC-like DNA-binding protein [Variovorax boronicumulans]|uniref:AraC family transcriptional regulator n=1 Tax=Variovorax boronicumulans TaxID=436515 RepID=UPI00277E01F6|nr:helix-turn-helix domain-containing protein [Variovorax boronicumulans]MDQ0035293.1 AraC-like DNA-binding protein [Variovorax boronicumulans]